MSFALLDSLFDVRTIRIVRGVNNIIPILWGSTVRAKFCSEKKIEDATAEDRLGKLLKESPVRPELEEFWDPKKIEELEAKSESRQIIDASTTSVMLFPGQGNQFVGMAKSLLKYPTAVKMFDVASQILGYDLLKVCNEGPEKKLNSTEYCQPATLVCSLALLEKVKDERPWAITRCKITCGYSLGEFSALTFAGCLTFENAVKLVKVRANAMEKCCKKVPGGMVTVFFKSRQDLNYALKEAVEHCASKGIENPQCSVASYLFPNCKVIAGHMEALNYLMSNSKKYRLFRMSKLPVSGAFHSLLMEDAVEPFKEKLDKMELKAPVIKVYSNVTAEKYKDVRQIKKILPQQICKAIKWEQIIQNVYGLPSGSEYPMTFECGPGNSLKTVFGKINKTASENSYSISL